MFEVESTIEEAMLGVDSIENEFQELLEPNSSTNKASSQMVQPSNVEPSI